MTASIAELADAIRKQLDKDESLAREASGDTVVGTPGHWTPAPDGDEWVASDYQGDVELLVALRPGLPRPPQVTSGYWGVVCEDGSDHSDAEGWGLRAQFRHAARQDPATTLARVGRLRTLVTRMLAEPHGLVDDGAGGYDCPRRGTSAACQCGRDERVRAYLALLLPETTET
ncbi:DUF6221 family protein [Streptacidiphilus carbonis]|uniref:DUF6221 family protein n=1 Tax=Streptacidiphilus carbonis TaxID=105422 RepID=UPI0005A739EB|nr:DUF6221 family protein [Streptacidiphilus carbonis]